MSLAELIRKVNDLEAEVREIRQTTSAQPSRRPRPGGGGGGGGCRYGVIVSYPAAAGTDLVVIVPRAVDGSWVLQDNTPETVQTEPTLTAEEYDGFVNDVSEATFPYTLPEDVRPLPMLLHDGVWRVQHHQVFAQLVDVPAGLPITDCLLTDGSGQVVLLA